MICRCRFAGDEEGPRWHRQLWIGSEPVVQHDDMQRVEQLALVFMNALNLAVENRIAVDNKTRCSVEPTRKSLLGGLLGLAETVHETAVVGKWQQPLQLTEIVHPSVANRLRDQTRQISIGL